MKKAPIIIAPSARAERFGLGLSYQFDGDENLKIKGVLMNDSNNSFSGVFFNYVILDPQSGKAIDAIPMCFNNIAPRESKNFEFDWDIRYAKYPDEFECRLELNVNYCFKKNNLITKPYQGRG